MLRDQAREDRNEALAIVACLAECMLSILESALEYINQWAFCYIGIYGFDFKASGSAVMALFKSRGWTAIINDNLSGTALGFGSIAVGTISFFVCKIIHNLRLCKLCHGRGGCCYYTKRLDGATGRNG